MNRSIVPKNFEEIYDKYASLIYGNICRVVNDKKTADKIFLEIFPEIITRKIIEAEKPLNIPALLRFIYKFSGERCDQNTLPGIDNSIFLITLACSDHCFIQQAAHKLGITKQEAAKMLYNEFAAFKNKAGAV